MPKTQLVICGSIAIDRIMNFNGRYRDIIKPEKLHVLSFSVLLNDVKDSPGGIGANIASSLAQLGEKPILLGSVGEDARGYIAKLEKLGVDVAHIHYSNLGTASFNVITDSEDSQVGGFYPGAMSDSQSLSFSAWQGQDILAIVCAHDPEAMSRQIEEAKKYGLRLVYDPGQQVSDPSTSLADGVAAAELLFLNDYELSVLCERLGCSEQELKARVPILVTTLGKSGSVIEGKNLTKPITIAIAKAKQVVDPTGAGDGYRAGFLYGYSRGWDLKTCGQLGSVIAALIIEEYGTQRLFTRQEVMDYYKENFNQEINL